MKQANKIKKAEKNFLIFFVTLLFNLKNLFISFFKLVFKACDQKITIMFIPHSEKKVFNFRINTFALFMTIFFTIGIIISMTIAILVWKNNITDYNKVVSDKLDFQQKSLDYEQMVLNILESHSGFQMELDKLLDHLDSPAIKKMKENYVYQLNQGGPVNQLSIVEMNKFEKEKYYVDQLTNDYKYSIQAFTEINRLSKKYNKLLKDIPFGNPVQGPYAITSGFGLRIHPIHKVLDMHQGIDMAYQSGTPIISTAPGIVEKVEFSPLNYGWYCKIRHEMGFYTLYAHLRSQPIVSPGDKVRKGTLIGYMGSTGATTGTHLHYEIRLGNNLLDPIKFVSIY